MQILHVTTRSGLDLNVVGVVPEGCTNTISERGREGKGERYTNGMRENKREVKRGHTSTFTPAPWSSLTQTQSVMRFEEVQALQTGIDCQIRGFCTEFFFTIPISLHFLIWYSA